MGEGVSKLDKLGPAIKRARWTAFIKQKDLAKKLGMANSYLSEIESGKRIPGLENLEKIEKVLGPIWSTL
jgi:transcriptional regulator with XRE-family HTH domain